MVMVNRLPIMELNTILSVLYLLIPSSGNPNVTSLFFFFFLVEKVSKFHIVLDKNLMLDNQMSSLFRRA